MRRVPEEREVAPAVQAPETQRVPAPTRADTILALQRSMGNRAVSRLVSEDTAKSALLARAPTPPAPPVPAAPAPAPDFVVRDVDRRITETISHAPRAFHQWNGTYDWRSKWRLRLDLRAEVGELDVIVWLHSTASAAVKRAWENAITAKWSNRFAFCVKRETPIQVKPGVFDRYEEMFPIKVLIGWADRVSDAHYVIRANAAGADEGGRAGVGGTTSMTGWGTADTQDMTHEFGHILGCPEEYFTTNGVDYAAGGKAGFRDPGAGVMNNPAGPALARNFDVIRQEAATLRGVAAGKTEIAPWPG